MKKIFCAVVLVFTVFYTVPYLYAAGDENSALEDVMGKYKDLTKQWSAVEKSMVTKIKPAPDFRLSTLNGKYYALENYKNKQAVVLFFWTTWCPYCRKELSELNEKNAILDKDDIVLLAVNSGEKPETVSKFVKDLKLDFPVLTDKYLSVAEVYDVLGVPTYILINKYGYIVYQNNQFPDNYQKLLEESS
jgi:peroxiredoxin